MAYNPQDEYDQAKKYAESLNQAVDIGAAPQIQNITGQIQGVQEQFNPYRNAAEVQSRIDAKTLAEQMANTGLTRSGTNLTAQTALTTTKQNTLSGINKAESAARKDLISQLNAYIAQRDAAKQNNLATAQQQAYQNVSDYNRATSLAELNDKYNKENAAIANTYAQENARINNDYNIQLTRLNDELATAREEKNFARESELAKQQAELNRQHDIAISNLNAQHAAEQQRIDNEAAAARQAADNEAAMARQAANNAAAMARQAADNIAAMARTQYSANKSSSGGYINPNTGKKYPDTVSAAIDAVNSGHNSSPIMIKGLEIYDDISMGKTTKSNALDYIKQNYGTGQINRSDLDYLLLAAGFNPNDVNIKINPTGRYGENMQNRY